MIRVELEENRTCDHCGIRQVVRLITVGPAKFRLCLGDWLRLKRAIELVDLGSDAAEVR